MITIVLILIVTAATAIAIAKMFALCNSNLRFVDEACSENLTFVRRYACLILRVIMDSITAIAFVVESKIKLNTSAEIAANIMSKKPKIVARK